MAKYRRVFGMLRVETTFDSKRYGRLVTVGPSFRIPQPNGKCSRSYQVCECDCGSCTVVSRSNLVNGTTKSCGCLHVDAVREACQIHGASKRDGSPSSNEYDIWTNIRQRCNNPNNPVYHNYGGRGIRVCVRWDDFNLFYSDMGPRPSTKHSIDRIDVNGNYEPANCRWATPLEQAQNKRNHNYLTHDGKTLYLAEWVRITGIPVSVIRQRVFKLGWSVGDALTTPVRTCKKRK